MIGAARALAQPEVPDVDAGWEVELTHNNATVERHRIVNLIVANGRTIGGGRRVAPRASLEDGLLDLALVRAGSRVDLAAVGARLLAGRPLDGDAVVRRRVRTVRVVSDPPIVFNVDGDTVPRGDVSFSVVPRALRVVVGPGYQPTVVDEDRAGDHA